MKLDQKKERIEEFRKRNISVIFRTTAISLIISELTGVIAVLIDGIVASRGLGEDVYSGISLLRPFSSMISMFAGFFSTGCNLVCSRLIGTGRKEEANEAFNLSSFLSLALSSLIIILCICFPSIMLNLCGVPLSKYPELNPYLFDYLTGYIISVPALMLIQIFGPILVIDNGKKIFTISSFVLCIVDIAGDLMNVYIFHGGAFGMGFATSVAYLAQLIILIVHFLKRSSYFRLSFQFCRLRCLKELIRNGFPALVKKLSGTLRDILVNYINIMVALSTAAIAARGIQSDLFQFLFCIPTGLGRALISMVGIYYSANDLFGLKRLLSYAVQFGTSVVGIISVITFITAPFVSQLYTSDPEVLSLAVFSIRWMSVALIFDTAIVLLQHYFQGTGNLKKANILSIGERFVTPVICALVLGFLFGSKGILASVAVSKIILLFVIILNNCIHNHGIPKELTKLLFLPKEFGGKQSDNLYAEIRTVNDAVAISEQTHQFCREQNVCERTAVFIALCVEEMTVNVLEHAEKKQIKDVCIDFRLFVNEDTVLFTLMDLSEQFDPTLFYERHQKDKPEDILGIRIVNQMAREIRYHSTFKSNNLAVFSPVLIHKKVSSIFMSSRTRTARKDSVLDQRLVDAQRAMEAQLKSTTSANNKEYERGTQPFDNLCVPDHHPQLVGQRFTFLPGIVQ